VTLHADMEEIVRRCPPERNPGLIDGLGALATPLTPDDEFLNLGRMKNRAHFALLGLLVATSPTLSGCGSEGADPAPAPGGDILLAPPPEGKGIQFQMNTQIGPGVEAEHCRFVQVPPEGLLINRDEVRFTKGSHHFLLYETPYTSIPTKTATGEDLAPGAVFDCVNRASFGFEVAKLVAGSQNSDGDSFLNFPSDVALRVAPGQVLLMNAHYINASAEPIEPEVRVNLYTIPAEQVKQYGEILFWYNPFIKVGATSTSRAHMRCMIHDGGTLMNVQSHMHAHATSYAAWLPGAEPFYTNSLWKDVPMKSFDDGMEVEAGTFIDFYCDYNNTAPNDIFTGPRATDEMCMLIGSYYPANAVTSKCAADPSAPDKTRSLGGEWVGSGQATCAATQGCFEQAFSATENVNRGLSSCILESDPAVSKEMSAALRCQLLHREDAATTCKVELDACLAK
jgi:hypothetical protein